MDDRVSTGRALRIGGRQTYRSASSRRAALAEAVRLLDRQIDEDRAARHVAR